MCTNKHSRRCHKGSHSDANNTLPPFLANIYGPSIITGHHTAKNKANYWVIGTPAGVLIPYNIKQKLGLIRSNRWPNIVIPEGEVNRLCAIYREAELRGIGFGRPK